MARIISLGVISANMCLKRAANHKDSSNSLEEICMKKVKKEQVIVIECEDKQLANSVTTVPYRSYNNSKSIKKTLLTELVMANSITSKKEMDILENIEIPSQGFIANLEIPLAMHSVSLRILPSVSVNDSEAMQSDVGNSIPSDQDVVPWTIYHGQEEMPVGLPLHSQDYRVFSFHENIGITDFLTVCCSKVLNVIGRIDYILYIQHKPLVFGYAIVTPSDKKKTPSPKLSFFFSRVLCSKEMVKLLALEI